MKILQICAYAAPYDGNFIKSLRALDESLAKDGHETVYAFPHIAENIPWCRELAESRRVYFLPLAKARLKPKTYSAIKKILNDEKIDIAHSHFELYDMPLAAVLPKGVRMIWHLHDAVENGYKNDGALRRIIFKLHYKTFSKRATLVSVSEKHKDFVVSKGFRRENALVVPNGSDLSRVKKVDGGKTKEYDFLIFAWDFLRKGADIAIAAAKKLSAEGHEFRIGFVGNDKTWRNEGLIEAQDEPWFVKQGFVDDVNELYAKSKVFLHISRAEGCSYALQEVIYSGLPVICSDISENGFALGFPSVIPVACESVEETAAAMRGCIEKGFCFDESAIKASSDIIEEKYSLEVWVKEIKKIYCEGAGR